MKQSIQGIEEMKKGSHKMTVAEKVQRVSNSMRSTQLAELLNVTNSAIIHSIRRDKIQATNLRPFAKMGLYVISYEEIERFTGRKLVVNEDGTFNLV